MCRALFLPNHLPCLELGSTHLMPCLLSFHLATLYAPTQTCPACSDPQLQGDALRPFASILKHSDSAQVRELAVACVSHAVAAHPRGLGSGWRSVIEALTVAAGDESPGGCLVLSRPRVVCLVWAFQSRGAVCGCFM